RVDAFRAARLPRNLRHVGRSHARVRSGVDAASHAAARSHGSRRRAPFSPRSWAASPSARGSRDDSVEAVRPRRVYAALELIVSASAVALPFALAASTPARARLKSDGLLCQWAHPYDISAADLQSIVRPFASVFPQGMLWLVGEGDLLLIGSPGSRLDERLAHVAEGGGRAAVAVAETLASVGISPASAALDLLSLLRRRV